MLFPFYNPAFAIGIGLIYWLVTWQFQNLVTQYDISSGKIDGLGITTSLWSVLPYHAALSRLRPSSPRSAWPLMLGGLYATLVWYVDAVERPRSGAYSPSSWSARRTSWRT